MDDITDARTWHFHVRASGLHACVAGIVGDTQDEAAEAALDQFVDAWYDIDAAGDGDLERLFGNANLTWCGGSGYCHCQCHLAVHVVRMQDIAVSELLVNVTADTDPRFWPAFAPDAQMPLSLN